MNPYASKQSSRDVRSSANHAEVDLTKDADSVTPQSSYQQEQLIYPPPPTTTFHAPAQNQHTLPAAQQSWDEHTRDQNPFQTAREYSWAGKDDVHHQPAPGYKDVHHPPAPGYNPYAQPPPPPDNNPPPPEQPMIRESLKRKFQPPNKRAAVANRAGEVRL